MTPRPFTVACVVTAALGVAIAAQAALTLWRAHAANLVIARLGLGGDASVGEAAPEAVLAARGRFLAAHGHGEEAQAIADRLSGGSDAAARAGLFYALGTTHLHRALVIFRIEPMKQVVPLINLAKGELRQAIVLDPGDWDARWNLAIADALVREADPPPPTKGDTMAGEHPMWPDVPGTPNGLP